MKLVARDTICRAMQVILFCIAGITSLQGQVYPFVNYSVRQGLVNSNVYDIAQDQTGFMWLGTDNGLSRFDGLTFKNITSESLGLTSFISSVAAAPDGKILFGCGRHGIFELDPLTGKIKQKNSDHISLSNRLLIKDNLLVSLKEYHHFDFLSLSTGKKIYEDEISVSRPENKALSMFRADSELYLGRTDGLYVFRNGLQHKINIKGLGNVPVYSIFEDKSYLLIGSEGVIYKIENYRVIDTLELINGPEKRIRDILVDERGNIWFNIWGLKDIYTFSVNKLTNVSQLSEISNCSISRILQDKSGTIWAGTLGKGLFHFNNNQFLIYPSLANNDKSIRKICKTTEGGLLLGTDDGIAYLDPEKEKIFSEPHMKEMIPFVRAITKSNENEYIVAITDIRLTRPLEKAYTLRNENFKIRYAHGSSLWNDPASILIGNWDNSILVYRKSDYRLTGVIDSIFIVSNSIQRINCIYRDEYSRTWIGGQQGICIRNEADEKVFLKQQEEVLKIESFDKYTILLVTQSGFSLFRNHMDVNKIYEIKSIAIHNMTCGVLIDTNEFLAGTNHGLIYRNGGKTIHMSIHDGIPSDNINDIFYEKGSSFAWVATSGGLMRLDIKALGKNDPGNVSIDHIVFQQDQNIWEPSSYNTFEHNKNSFRLGFHTFHYNNAMRVKYQYKVDDNEWLIAPSNEIQFASMEPGDHSIRLRSGLSGENWGPDKTILVHIEPPFYRSWWFYLITIVMGTLLLLLFLRHQVRALKLKQEEKAQTQQKIVELQQKALASNLNPHFVFNSLNAIQHFINSKSPAEANEFLAKFARLMRMHLNMAEKTTILLHEEIQRLEFYLSLEQMRFDDKMEWSIRIDPSIDPYHTEIPNMIIQPFIENAIWHGIMPSAQKGFISLAIEKISNGLSITITDNGVGFQSQEKSFKGQYESKGTRLIRERLLLLDPTVSDVLQFKNLSPGTIVKVLLTPRMFRVSQPDVAVSVN